MVRYRYRYNRYRSDIDKIINIVINKDHIQIQ